MTDDGAYFELHSHTCYSLGDAVPHPHELIDRAAALGIGAVALTDHDNLYGMVAFVSAAKKRGIHPVIGCELTLEDTTHLTLLVETNKGYSNLTQLISIGQANEPKKGKCSLPWIALETHAKGIICLTGCRQGLLAQQVLANDLKAARATLERLTAIFGHKNVYVELQRRNREGDIRLSKRLAALAQEQNLPYVATGNVHYLTRDDADVRTVMVSVKHRVPIPEAPSLQYANYEYYLRSPQEMRELFADLPDAITRTVEIANRCHVTLPRGMKHLPKYPTPEGVSAADYLRRLCEEQLSHYYPGREAEAKARLDKELDIIFQLGMENYFLILWSFGQFFKSEDILFHVCGSGAGSIVVRLLGLSLIDPLSGGIVLERFISLFRDGTPDLDFVLHHRKREHGIQHAFTTFGIGHAAMAATYVTYKRKSSVRDAGYALGMTLTTIAKAVEAQENGEPLSERGQLMFRIAEKLHGRVRHLGQHNGGIILTERPLAEVFAVEPAAMKKRKVVQLDKDWLEELLQAKTDFLGSRTVTACADSAEAIFARYGIRIDFYEMTYDDPRVYEFIRSCKVVGVFQLGSGAELRVLVELQPENIDDIKIQIALIRPGPIVAQMLKPYLRRLKGEEPVTYHHPLLRPALQQTLGVIVFQDQVIQIVHDVAGFDLGRAELVRKALGKKNAKQAIEEFHTEFIVGAEAHSVASPIAERIWTMIASFANYSFCEAHAADHARVVYWTAWLRFYYPLEFWYGLLRNVPLGTYPARVLEAEARRTGTKFLPFDINLSQAMPTIEQNAIRHGLGYVRGIGEKKAEAIVEARGNQPFVSLVDVIARTKLPRRALEALIRAGALDRFGERRQLLWDLADALDIAHKPPRLPLVIPDEYVAMQPFTPDEKVAATVVETGVTVDIHITELKKDAFDRAGCLRLSQVQRMPIGATVRVGGIMADGLRTPPTAKGSGFLRLERREGFVEVIVPATLVADRKSRKALRSAFIVIEGRLQRTGKLISVVAHAIHPLQGYRNQNVKTDSKRDPISAKVLAGYKPRR